MVIYCMANQCYFIWATAGAPVCVGMKQRPGLFEGNWGGGGRARERKKGPGLGKEKKKKFQRALAFRWRRSNGDASCSYLMGRTFRTGFPNKVPTNTFPGALRGLLKMGGTQCPVGHWKSGYTD